MFKNRFRRLKCIEISQIGYIVKTAVCACIIHGLKVLSNDWQWLCGRGELGLSVHWVSFENSSPGASFAKRNDIIKW
jgi:hypothetical protein